MTTDRDPVPRARESARWLAGLAFLGLMAGGVVAAAVLLWQAVDIEELFRSGEILGAEEARVVVPGLEPAPPATPGDGFRIGVLTSGASAEFLPGEAAGHHRQVEHWQKVVESAGGTVVRVASDEIEDLGPETPLVVPLAPCLSFDAGSALFRHLRAGGSLVLEGAVGTRDEACEWRGWSVLRSLTGAERTGDVDPRDGLFVTVPAGLPLSHGLAPGSRIELGHDMPVALEVEGGGAYWSDWGLAPAPVAGTEGLVTAALSRVVEGSGRLVWFGFLATDAARAMDRERVHRLHSSAVLWTARQPMAELAPWPEAHRAALLVTQDVEAEPENARPLAEELQRTGTPGTFFVVSDMVEGRADIARAVTAGGEVGSHTVDHRTLAGRSWEDQLTRLRHSRRSAEAWSERAVEGLRPPAERFDSLTMEAWAQVGGTYLAAENEGRSAAPELHPLTNSRRAMVVVPRLVKDDYNVLFNDWKSWDEGLVDIREGLRRSHRLGGVGLLTVHTQLVDIGRVESLGEMLEEVLSWPGWWPATVGEVAGWWRARHDASVRVQRDGDDALEVTLRAPSDTALVGGTITVTPDGSPEAWEPEPGTPGVRFGHTPWSVEVVVDSVASGDSVRIRLRRTAE